MAYFTHKFSNKQVFYDRFIYASSTTNDIWNETEDAGIKENETVILVLWKY